MIGKVKTKSKQASKQEKKKQTKKPNRKTKQNKSTTLSKPYRQRISKDAIELVFLLTIYFWARGLHLRLVCIPSEPVGENSFFVCE